MCELLVKASDNVNSNPTKDLCCYKRGDIVVACPDGWQWGSAERPPQFIVLKVTGLSVSEAQQYMQSAEDANGNMLLRRKHRIPVSAAWILSGTVTVNKAAFTAAVALKV